MREIQKRLEMLEAACGQLDKGTGPGARLALILLHSLADITMYEKVEYLFARDSYFEHVSPRKYSNRLRKKALRDFAPKVDILVRDTDTISEDQGKVLKVGHLLRNEAYHRGKVREGIIREVSRAYVDAVCGILPQLWNGVFTFVPGEDVGAYLRQFNVEATSIDKGVLKSVCDSFLVGSRGAVGELGNALSSDLIGQIEKIVSSCEYMGEGGYEDVSAEDVLKALQFHPQFHEKHEFAQTDEGFREFFETYERQSAVYVPPITLATLQEWKNRAEDICSMALPGAALAEYSDIDEKLTGIQKVVSQALYEFEKSLDL